MAVLCTPDYPDNYLLMRHLSLRHSTERHGIGLTSKTKHTEQCCSLKFLSGRGKSELLCSPEVCLPVTTVLHLKQDLILNFHNALIVSVVCSLSIVRVDAFVLMEAVAESR